MGSYTTLGSTAMMRVSRRFVRMAFRTTTTSGQLIALASNFTFRNIRTIQRFSRLLIERTKSWNWKLELDQ